jgi:hypothetical protein
MKKNLKDSFTIQKYTVSTLSDGRNRVIIEGLKLAPPSKRITLHQQNVRVLSAKIIYQHKKGDIEFEVTRINRIKSFNEIRLHTNSPLYPGSYIVTLEYRGKYDGGKLKSEAG